MTDQPTETLRDDRTVRCRVCGHLAPLLITYGSRGQWPRHCGQKMEWLAAHSGEEPQTVLVEQKDLPADAARLLREHAWDLLEDETASHAAQAEPLIDRVLAIFDNYYHPDEKWPARMRAEIAALHPPAPVEPLKRYGILWQGLQKPICAPMADGYWTPWHIADAALTAALREHPVAPQIECPLCGEVVKQVASATLDLALWQHVHWVCKREHPSLREALRKLANEASGFWVLADPDTHGHANMTVLKQRIDAAYAALREYPVAVETPKVRVKCPWCGEMCAQRLCGRCERMLPYEAFNELSSDPRQSEPPIISRDGPA